MKPNILNEEDIDVVVEEIVRRKTLKYQILK